MYSEMATEEDKKMVEDWKADADGILIFVRLSSNLTIRAADSVINGHHQEKPTLIICDNVR